MNKKAVLLLFLLVVHLVNANLISAADGENKIACGEVGYCVNSESSCKDAGGIILSEEEYICYVEGSVCCTVEVESNLYCQELNGVICDVKETCSGEVRKTIDGSCCLGECESNTLWAKFLRWLSRIF